MKIVLIGYMGSGKSLIGKKLAANTAVDFFDLDTQIEQQYGDTIPNIFAQRGEIYFRKLEAQVLRALLNSDTNCVLATGGGTPCYAQNIEAINSSSNTKSVYLHANLDSLVARLKSERKGRPLISHLETQEALTDFIRKHLFDRSPYYMQAQLVIKTSNLSPQEVVEKIVLQLF